MTPSDTLVIVTFVGGPLHGLQQVLSAPAAQLWRDLPNGSALLYGCRWRSPGGGRRAVYSPVAMSEHAYRELLQTVSLELPESLSSHDAPARRAGGTP